jgi:hypothetical protein
MLSTVTVSSLKTSTRRQKQTRNKKLLGELNRLLAMPGAMATACEEKIAKRYGLDRSTIRRIRKQASTT